MDLQKPSVDPWGSMRPPVGNHWFRA